MKRLYTPFKVNKLELKNRVIMSPMSIGHTVDGFIMDDVVEFYKRRAQGGVGLIIFANMQWDKLRYNPNHGAMLTDENISLRLRSSPMQSMKEAARFSHSSCIAADVQIAQAFRASRLLHRLPSPADSPTLKCPRSLPSRRSRNLLIGRQRPQSSQRRPALTASRSKPTPATCTVSSSLR